MYSAEHQAPVQVQHLAETGAPLGYQPLWSYRTPQGHLAGPFTAAQLAECAPRSGATPADLPLLQGMRLAPGGMLCMPQACSRRLPLLQLLLRCQASWCPCLAS